MPPVQCAAVSAHIKSCVGWIYCGFITKSNAVNLQNYDSCASKVTYKYETVPVFPTVQHGDVSSGFGPRVVSFERRLFLD
jgi:hypothetical protein